MKVSLSIIFFAACVFPLFSQKPEPVKIGYLIQDQSYISARHGAELAVKLANEKGGLNGRPFQVVVKSMEGPWGTGSKQAVDLIFNDKVWVLFGTHDGRNAHLVEQAATKSTTVFISAWASDPTLSQAFVPWFFNMVPTDLQQSAALISDIYDVNKISRVAVITDNSYESKQAVKAFRRINDEKRKIDPVVLDYENFQGKPANLPAEIKNSGARCILLLSDPLNSAGIIQILKEYKSALPIYAALTAINENILNEQQLQQISDLVRVPSGSWSATKMQHFIQAYFNAYGKYPGLSAAFAFDGMNVLIEAIKTCKSAEREDIQKSIEGLNIQGVTGQIAFDEHGNRKFSGTVCRMHHGMPIAGIK